MNEPTQEVFGAVLLRMPAADDGRGLGHLSWSVSGLGDRVVQVYVNDELYDTVFDAAQRELWLRLDRSRDNRVELLAVDLEEAWADRSAHLRGWAPRFVTEAALRAVRDESLPIESRAVVSVDGEDDAGHRFWGPGDACGGFGGLFGIGAFGYGLATGPGHGLGAFGTGAFGADGAAWSWRRDDLPVGDHALGLRVEDGAGDVAAEMIEPRSVTIDAMPRPPHDPSIEEGFVLRWT